MLSHYIHSYIVLSYPAIHVQWAANTVPHSSIIAQGASDDAVIRCECLTYVYNNKTYTCTCIYIEYYFAQHITFPNTRNLCVVFTSNRCIFRSCTHPALSIQCSLPSLLYHDYNNTVNS